VNENNGSIVVTGEDIEAARLLAIRAALALEIRTGLTRHGRPARTIAAEILGLDGPGRRPNKVTVYRALDKYLVERYPGRVESRPLS
jgi:hypothetical protein